MDFRVIYNTYINFHENVVDLPANFQELSMGILFCDPMRHMDYEPSICNELI